MLGCLVGWLVSEFVDWLIFDSTVFFKVATGNVANQVLVFSP